MIEENHEEVQFWSIAIADAADAAAIVPFDCAAGGQGAHSDMRVFDSFAFMYVGWQCVGI